MTRTEQNRMVERYISRRMSTEEERAFLVDLERDADLRRQVDAEQFVIRTLQRDRDAIPREHPRTRAKVLGLLATLGAGSVATGTAKAASQAAAHAAGTGSALLGAGVLKAVLAVIGTAVMAAGVWYATSTGPAENLRTPEAAPRLEQSAPAASQPVIETPQAPAAVREAEHTVSTSPAPSPRAAVSAPEKHGLMVRPSEGVPSAADSVQMKVKVTLPGKSKVDDH